MPLLVRMKSNWYQNDCRIVVAFAPFSLSVHVQTMPSFLSLKRYCATPPFLAVIELFQKSTFENDQGIVLWLEFEPGELAGFVSRRADPEPAGGKGIAENEVASQ